MTFARACVAIALVIVLVTLARDIDRDAARVALGWPTMALFVVLLYLIEKEDRK